ncbi:MAG: Holo-[acyl-carrier-protein] synthase [Alphaproteobacteria bacterium MarineAlpha5_Bin12]|nr:holo-ACP synthase [Pelagibacteraceae bacterium]PPR41796.1 MAG: Holo-[acyl-carrier-protein] synthase [Alphaproteobacteria bacterium MarineAlpha5_Bin12]|tara:strand:- start:11374 stop:11766 length:393 start_codon:yes stop_codon:yes gene_type:complete
MIIGIGSDVIDINRINGTIKKFGYRFLKRCFNEKEINSSNKKFYTDKSIAKKFAAKEAISKALGTGISNGIFWKDILISNDKFGKPIAELRGNAEKKLNKLTPPNKTSLINLTISDENNLAYAFVIISFS